MKRKHAVAIVIASCLWILCTSRYIKKSWEGLGNIRILTVSGPQATVCSGEDDRSCCKVIQQGDECEYAKIFNYMLAVL